jgi:hypothetical protein
MRLSEIEFGSLLSYSPRGNSDSQCRSRTVTMALKNDQYVTSGSNQILMSDYIAERLRIEITRLPFVNYFQTNPILIPVPNSSFNKSGTLWVPQRLANALFRKGLGMKVEECLKRVVPLPKSATSLAANRPKATAHFDSLEVERILFEPTEILLIDDVVTRGATLLGAANKLLEAYPDAHIRAFAVIRTISSPEDFTNIYDPRTGTITLRGEGTFRVP